MNYFPGNLSPFEEGYVRLQLMINGSWTTISMDELSEEGVQLSRGSKPGSVNQEPGSLTFSLKDPTGKWSPRHPASPYYGLIGHGTKIRLQIKVIGVSSFWNRFYGEVVSFTPVWTKKGGPSARVDVEAAGTYRRLGQGHAVTRSTLRRVLEAQSGLAAYWPMEEDSGATTFASTNDADAIEPVTAGVSAGASDSLQGSENIPEINGGSLRATVPAYTQTVNTQVRAILKNSSATPNGSTVLRINFFGGSLGYVDLIYGNSTTVTVNAYRTDGTLISGGGSATVGLSTSIYLVELRFVQSGGTLNWTWYATTALVNSFGSYGGSWASTSAGRVKSIQVNPNSVALGNSIAAHISVANAINVYSDNIFYSMNGYQGESAVDRLIRLTDELGINFTYLAAWTGDSSEAMGYQKPGETLDLMRECADTDMGILRESASELYDLVYVPLSVLQSPKGTNYETFTYVENLFNPFVPVEDDEGLVNKVTVTRNVGGGGSRTTVVEDGPLGTNAVGVYEDEVSLNLETPFAARQQADWRANIGTWNEARWPQIGVDLADYRIVGDQPFQSKVMGVEIGNAIRISGLPSWLPPFDVYQIVVGITETITSDSHKVVWNCMPAGPYRAGHWGETTDRYSGDGTVTAGSLTTTATTFTVTPPAGVSWTHVDGDYDILIDGERMTVKNVVGTTFTVTRSVNGIVKTHAAGAAITLLDPALWGL